MSPYWTQLTTFHVLPNVLESGRMRNCTSVRSAASARCSRLGSTSTWSGSTTRRRWRYKLFKVKGLDSVIFTSSKLRYCGSGRVSFIWSDSSNIWRVRSVSGLFGVGSVSGFSLEVESDLDFCRRTNPQPFRPIKYRHLTHKNWNKAEHFYYCYLRLILREIYQ